MGPRDFDVFGMSHCTEDPDQIPRRKWFGFYKECSGSVNRKIRVLLQIPEGVKNQRGKAPSDATLEEEEESEGKSDDPSLEGADLPCLNGHESIAAKDGDAVKKHLLDGRQKMIDQLLEMDGLQLEQ